MKYVCTKLWRLSTNRMNINNEKFILLYIYEEDTLRRIFV